MAKYVHSGSGGLIVPKDDKPWRKLPPFKDFMFECYYLEDVDRFTDLVRSKGGYYNGCLRVSFLNFQNDKVSGKYVCLYQWHEKIDMEVLC